MAFSFHEPTMNRRHRKGPPEASDPDAGIWQGQAVAHRFVAPDGAVILVGRTAVDNDILTFKLASPNDFWLHVAGTSGSHVVVRNPDGLARLPRDTLRFAASLAAGYSKARQGGRVAVHVAQVSEVHKPRGAPAGQVTLSRFESVLVTPSRGEGDLSQSCT
jgi:predicted ribosome quality control (RQC) complex YloA/Tae2 family protein